MHLIQPKQSSNIAHQKYEMYELLILEYLSFQYVCKNTTLL
jgi:hypothetical protein